LKKTESSWKTRCTRLFAVNKMMYRKFVENGSVVISGMPKLTSIYR